MRFYTMSSVLAIALAVPSAAHAAAPGDDQSAAIIVTGRTEGYKAIDTTSATKTATPILDVPQSITVLTRAQIDDQAIRSVADLVRFVPGVSAGQGEGNRDQITLRGNNSTADFFVDGLRDDVQYYRSFYNVDRVEVLKGPNATIFGRGGGGGVFNRVTKQALPGVTQGEATGSVDSFGSWTIGGDANLDLGPAALRVNAFYEALDNHRDAYDGERYAVNPVLGTELAGGAKLQLGYEYLRDERVSDRGIPSLGGRPLQGFRDTFFGAPGINEADIEAHIVTARVAVPLTSALSFNAQALYGNYDKLYVNAFAAAPVAINATTGARSVAIEAYADPTRRENVIAQGNLVWRGSTGGIDHVLLLGGEYTSQDTDNERINGFFGGAPTSANRRRSVALADPIVIPPFSFIAGPAGNGNRAVASGLTQTSLYLQDKIGLGEHVDLIAGLRYDRLDLAVTNTVTGQRVERSDDLWSPRVGLVVKPVPQASLYASYTRSYLPQSGDQFLSLDATSATLAPETFDNYEIGAKWDITPALSATAALYRLDRGNTRAAGPTAGSVVLTGAQRSQGFELGLTGKLTKRWQTSLGYANTSAEVTTTTSAAPAGRQIAQVPRHQLSLWNRYQLIDRLGVGMGVYHQSDSFTSLSNAVTLPGYTRVDLAVFLALTDTIDAQLNVENVTDTTYFPVAHNDSNISPGAPLNARFTLRAKF